MQDNLTPNPFPSGKGNRKDCGPFPWWEGEPERTVRKIGASPRFVAIGALAIYRAVVSPVIHAINGPACRFEPSCSAYARDAIAEYGIIRGGIMAAWRVARCNPLGGHGFDPVRGREAAAEERSR
jgi:putative membrane protein insertion efficiency factor